MAELPYISACVSCDIALFLNEEEQFSGVFTCPHCKHENNLGNVQQADEPPADPVEDETAPPPVEPSDPEPPANDPIEEAQFLDDAIEEPSDTTPEEVVEQPLEVEEEPAEGAEETVEKEAMADAGCVGEGELPEGVG